MEKKGLSAVVTTLIIILLVLVAVGIIWVVVRNVVEEGGSTIDLSVKCLDVSVKATGVTCGYTGTKSCNVTYTRESGGDDIDGIKIVYSDGIESLSQDVVGNIEPLVTKTETGFNVTALGNVTSVEVAVYFGDEGGTPQFCSTTRTFTNINLVP
jgi:hypothetical protein